VKHIRNASDFTAQDFGIATLAAHVSAPVFFSGLKKSCRPSASWPAKQIRELQCRGKWALETRKAVTIDLAFASEIGIGQNT